MILKRICVGVLLVLLFTPVWAINKCTSPDGKVAYQEEPCATSAKTATIQRAAGPLSSDEKERQASKACGIEPLPELPAIGWPEERFLACSLFRLRETPIINTTETVRGTSKQYVFRYHRAYVYVRDGVVTAVQR